MSLVEGSKAVAAEATTPMAVAVAVAAEAGAVAAVAVAAEAAIDASMVCIDCSNSNSRNSSSSSSGGCSGSSSGGGSSSSSGGYSKNYRLPVAVGERQLHWRSGVAVHSNTDRDLNREHCSGHLGVVFVIHVIMCDAPDRACHHRPILLLMCDAPARACHHKYIVLMY